MNVASRAIGAILASVLLVGCTSTAPEKPKREAKAPLFSCYRHIYNNSSCGWTFQDTGGGNGNAYFIDDNGGACTSNCTEKNGPCTVNPNCTITLQYTYSGGLSDGIMNVTLGSTTEQYSYNAAGVNLCPYINHQGQTGGISLNEPASGDMTADSCNPPWAPPH